MGGVPFGCTAQFSVKKKDAAHDKKKGGRKYADFEKWSMIEEVE